MNETGSHRLGALARGSFPFLALLYAALFSAYGTESPFLPSFLASRSLTATQIGFVLAAGTLVRLSLGPVIGWVADRCGARLVLSVAAAGSGSIVLLYLEAARFWPLLAISMLHALATASLNPLADALALASSSRERSFPYGWVRGVGSASFMLGTLASGLLVARYGLNSIVVVSSLLFLCMLAPIPRLRPVVTMPRGSRSEAGIGALFALPAFRRMLLLAALVIGSHAMSDAFAVIHWRANGVAPGSIGLLLAEAVGSEIVVFVIVGPFAIRRLKPGGCAAVAAGAGVARWAVLATTTEIAALSAAELLHGLTFSLMHLACMQVIGTVVPARLSATAQTVYGTLCLGLASAVITSVSGTLYDTFGAHAFFLMSLMCLAALPLSAGLKGRP